ncbi:Predicted arabinose efflux permease, MFS family [Dyella sp. OK004]|uniref:MFS transporter n=1 Tax=Dyella sp. OK004 TaxID=1855292 RepID=UPI0008EAE92F|nr:MFS transporter [Dyella sp. OK004]SFS07183.1 Predicted arabinose efflux permease, MFS family [Dyella sp. OK004]
MASEARGQHVPPVRLFALATAVIVLSLYLAQPLVGMIGPSLGLSPAAAGLIATLTLGGYALGLFLLVPLCDVVENRALVLTTLSVHVVALIAASCIAAPSAFLLASLLVGMSACAIQMLIPMAAAMTLEAQRGQVIGNIMSGLLLGVMLSRPLASLVAGRFGWHAVYALLAAAVALLLPALMRTLPVHRPAGGRNYFQLIASLWHLLREEPVLRRRAITAALCFAAFNAFWSTVALLLARAPFSLGSTGIAVFALVSVSGAVSAPIAGRLGDRGHARLATRAAHICVVAGLLLAWLAGSPWAMTHIAPMLSLALLSAAAILLDAGTIADQALGRRAINLLRPEARGRVNGLYTGVFFVGGAAGSALAGPAWAMADWNGVAVMALIFACAASVSGARR